LGGPQKTRDPGRTRAFEKASRMGDLTTGQLEGASPLLMSVL